MKTLSHFVATWPSFLRAVFRISLITTALFVSGCGQTGDLYLPGDPPNSAKKSKNE